MVCISDLKIEKLQDFLSKLFDLTEEMRLPYSETELRGSAAMKLVHTTALSKRCQSVMQLIEKHGDMERIYSEGI